MGAFTAKASPPPKVEAPSKAVDWGGQSTQRPLAREMKGMYAGIEMSNYGAILPERRDWRGNDEVWDQGYAKRVCRKTSATPAISHPLKWVFRLSDRRNYAMQFIAIACLLAALLSGCASSSTPSPTVTAVPTATPTPTPNGSTQSNRVSSIEPAIKTNARHLAERFDEGGVEREYFLDRYVMVTGIATRVDTSDDAGRLVVVLEGTLGTSVLCERPGGFREPRELFRTAACGRPGCACGGPGERIEIGRRRCAR